jgi:hypothetical protein
MGIRSGKGAEFDLAIGQLDRALSLFLSLYNDNLDDADRQTLKHHADDLVGCGKKMIGQLAERPARQQTRENPPVPGWPPWN